ncbi:hypothetical protein EJ02DRAFT_152565 [Clathrospora elynae]|uniref:Uncharacterized protein n=1 Tax=Clathrospora elynae TaxID=706981 RepID=A0A6A5STU6_9PLEO|nr:hypothetical protein EJ02DRAFT_152565 [Clathrospora elynae]
MKVLLWYLCCSISVELLMYLPLIAYVISVTKPEHDFRPERFGDTVTCAHDRMALGVATIRAVTLKVEPGLLCRLFASVF